MSAREAAVRAVAEALYVRIWGSDVPNDVVAAESRALTVEDAEAALAALATSADVRAEMREGEPPPCVYAPHLTCEPGGELAHPECVLAALGGAADA